MSDQEQYPQVRIDEENGIISVFLEKADHYGGTVELADPGGTIRHSTVAEVKVGSIIPATSRILALGDYNEAGKLIAIELHLPLTRPEDAPAWGLPKETEDEQPAAGDEDVQPQGEDRPQV